MENRKELRQRVYQKCNGKCGYCGCVLSNKFHIDHLEPIRRKWKYVVAYSLDGKKKTDYTKIQVNAMTSDEFGEIDMHWYKKPKLVSDGCENPHLDCFENYMPSCASCNINKHSMSLEHFRDLIFGFMKHLNEVSTQYKIAKRYGLIQETVKPIVFYFETL